MKRNAFLVILLACAWWLAACGTETETAGGGDDFPNTLGPVLAQELVDWSAERSLRPDQEGVQAEASASSSSAVALAKNLALTKSTSVVSLGDTLAIYSLDTLTLRIVADTVKVRNDELVNDGIADNERVYYFAEHKTRRATGATEYQRMVPLDTYLRAPEIDTARIRMREERLNWRSAVLDGTEDLSEVLDMDFVHFPADTLRDYPLYYCEVMTRGTKRLETRLLTETGDSLLVPGGKWLLRKVRFVNGDSAHLQEVGVVPGTQPWHGSALFHSFRAVNYAPENDWKRTEVSFAGERGYADGEAIAEGSFRMVVQRKQGTWVWEGSFDAESFSGTLTGPDGETQEIRYTR